MLTRTGPKRPKTHFVDFAASASLRSCSSNFACVSIFLGGSVLVESSDLLSEDHCSTKCWRLLLFWGGDGKLKWREAFGHHWSTMPRGSPEQNIMLTSRHQGMAVRLGYHLETLKKPRNNVYDFVQTYRVVRVGPPDHLFLSAPHKVSNTPDTRAL